MSKELDKLKAQLKQITNSDEKATKYQEYLEEIMEGMSDNERLDFLCAELGRKFKEMADEFQKLADRLGGLEE